MPVLNASYDDEDLVKIRREQDDPIIQYFIVKKFLNMSPGKISAQCSHGAQIFAFHYLNEKKKYLSIIPRGGAGWNRICLVDKWLEKSFRKVVLKASDSKFEKIKQELDCFLVKDAGLTEVEKGVETVLVLFPMYKSKTPKLIQRLRLL